MHSVRLILARLVPFTAVIMICLTPTLARAQGGEDVGTLADKSREAMEADRWEEALTLLDTAVKRYGKNAKQLFGPKFGIIHYRKGLCEIKLRRWPEAMKSFEVCYNDFANGGDVKAGGGNPFHKKALLRWGEAAIGAEDWALAIRQFKRFLEEKDKTETYSRGSLQVNLAICHYRLGKFKEGNEFLETAIKNKYDPAFNVPEAGIAAAFQALVSGAIDKGEEQPLLDFITKNRADIMLEPFETGEYSKLYMKLAADAFAAEMPRTALLLYQLIPSIEQVIQDTKVRINALSFREGVKDGVRIIRTKTLTDQLPKFEQDRRAQTVPEAVRLSATAFIHESAGNPRGAVAAYEQLESFYQKSPKREENLYNLVRTSSLIGAVANSEKYGQRFLKFFPNSPHAPQVRRLMLSSLFYEGEYDTCVEIASVMLPTLEKGSKEYDICLHVLGGSYYYTGQFDKAQPLLDEHVASFPQSQFAEGSLYFQASNLTRLQYWERSAALLDAFFKKYPDPNANMFYSFALYDRANCHYSLDQYPEALAKLIEIETKFPGAEVLEMTLNLKGAVQLAMKQPEAAEQSYLAALKLAETRGNDPAAGESLYYLVALLGEKKKDKDASPRLKDAVPFADRFWAKYSEGSIYNTQMAVAQLAAFDAVGRGEEALARLQGVIAKMAGSEQKSGLEAAINSYTEAYLEKHKPTELREHYYNFPGIDSRNTEARAILRMAVIGVYENLGKNAKGDDEATRRESAAMVKVLFQELKSDFQVKQLTNYILVRVGDYIRTKTSTPGEAMAFYDEVIGRPDQTDRFAALLGRGQVYGRSTQKSELAKAVADFDRVIADSQDKAERESAAFSKVEALMAAQDYDKAAAAAKFYLDRDKNGFTKKAAPVGLMLAQTYDKRGEREDAIAMYAKVWPGNNMGLVQVSAPAITRHMELLWERNNQARTNEKGQPVISDRQFAYDSGAKYIEATNRPEFQNKMTDNDRALWKGVEDLVRKYEADPSIKSLEQQKKDRAAGRR